MLKRCWPRSSTGRVTGMGNVSTGLPLTLPDEEAVSSSRWPRATVPSTSGRADRPSSKNVLGRNGTYLGWSCMSWRQAVKAVMARARRPAGIVLVRNFGYLARLQGPQKVRRRLAVEQRIGGLDTQKKAVARSQRKPGNVENRVIRHGQAAQGQQAEHGRQGREQNGHLEGDDDVRRPTVQGPPRDGDGEVENRDVILHQVPGQPAQDAADQHDQR